MKIPGGIAICVVGWSTLASAQQSELDLFALDSQLEQQVVSSTKTETRGAQTPAVVTVINADEIQARGYSSLADILRAVPGFYDVYDLVTHNIGVRGINGGARASGNVIKLMIDGHPVDFRPSTGNFFGEELIPLGVIERVEIIRGPASALYGANAFLGVVNVITKSGENIGGVKLVGQGMLIREHLGGGGGAVMGGSSGNVDVIVGANYLYTDRSGRGLPEESPVQGADRETYYGRAPTTVDRARPQTFFAKASLNNVLRGKVTFLATLQHLDAHGAFQDFGPLVEATRIALLNQNYRLNYEAALHEKFTLYVAGHYFNGAPTSRDRIDIGRPDFFNQRSVGADGFGFNLEGRVKAHHMFTLIVGSDFVHENHLLQSYSQKLITDVRAADGSILRAAGTIIPGEGNGLKRTFDNVGVYAQGHLTFKRDWSAIAGVRVDWHSIYGANPSARAGVVWAPADRAFSLKLLYGLAFKAPSAEQLFTQKLKNGDILGNENLKPQNAHTLELAGGYRLPKERGEISLNFFATDVVGRVEFIQFGASQQAQNTRDEWVVGGELDSRFVLARPLHLRFAAALAYTVAKSALPPPGLQEVNNALFPPYQLHLTLDYAVPWWGLRLSAEASYIGPRAASSSNALIAGKSYDLPGYFYTAVVVSTAGRKILPNRETSLALRISNLINYNWTEPGFGGIDVPAQGITAFLTIVQGL